MDEKRLSQNEAMDDEIIVDSKSQIIRILYDLLKKRPFIMFMGLLVFVRGVIII